MSQITMGNTYGWKLLWVIDISQITMGNTYVSNYSG